VPEPKASEAQIMALVLLAAGLVLAAPVVGRAGLPRAADLLMAGAAAAGVGSFLLAARDTRRAARAAGRTPDRRDTP
jgi:hypothetical protein